MSEGTDTSQGTQDGQSTNSTTTTTSTDAATATGTWDELFAGEDPVKVKEALSHARTWETRAKENFDKAKQFDALAEGSKSTEQRLNDRIVALESENQAAKVAAARDRIAREYKLADDDVKAFLTSSDEAEMTAVAKRLAERDADKKKNGNHVSREGSHTTTSTDPNRDFLRQLTG